MARKGVRVGMAALACVVAWGALRGAGVVAPGGAEGVGAVVGRSAGEGASVRVVVPESLRLRAERTREERRAALVAAPTKTAARGAERSAEARVREAFLGMRATRGLLLQQEERERLARAVLATDDGRRVVDQILTHPGYAASVFGDEAPEARFYATEIVRQAAKDGDWRYGFAIAGKIVRIPPSDAPPGLLEDLADVVQKATIGTSLESLRARSAEIRTLLGHTGGRWPMDVETRRTMALAMWVGLDESSPVYARRKAVAALFELPEA